MSEGLMLEAIAKMASRPVADVRRIHMLEADLGRVVRMLRSPDGASGDLSTSVNVAAPSARIVKPMKPMLAQPAPDIAEAFAMLGPEISFEHKIDGARVQVHHLGAGEVRIFSRRMNEITPSLPEVVEIASRLGERSAILDGEVIAVDASGRPVAFQAVMRRFGRTREDRTQRAGEADDGSVWRGAANRDAW
jgi:DNA ligase-1